MKTTAHQHSKISESCQLPKENLSLLSPRETLASWTRALVDLLYPPVCGICERALVPEERTICLICRARLNPHPAWQCAQCGATGGGDPPDGNRCNLCPPQGAGYQGIFAVTSYLAESARAVHLFKYERRLEMGTVMGNLMRERLSASLSHLGARVQSVAPVPLHWLRRWQRGFNQSLLLARAVAREMDLNLDPRLLRRVRHTRRQALVPRERRAANVRNAFALRRGRDVRGKGILLIDDVVKSSSQ